MNQVITIVLFGLAMAGSPQEAQAPDLAISPTNRAEALARLIPYPRRVTWERGFLGISEVVVSQHINPHFDDFVKIHALTSRMLSEAGCDVKEMGGPHIPTVGLGLDELPDEAIGEEAYRLRVGKRSISIRYRTPVGAFYAIQTLRQMIRHVEDRTYVAHCDILDWPAFPYRGLMHDVGRNFQSIEFLERQIDLLARYKLNVFHWHLTDNPGYRIESKKYPELNQPKNYRLTRNPGRYYTFEEINRFIEYCRARHVRVIPEIDLPGHSEYFKNTFGFDMQDPRGLRIVLDLLGEFCDHVDVPMIHIGSDEVRIANEDFLPSVVGLLRERGREVIAWRPGGPLPDERMITQLWTGGARAVAGVRVLDSRAIYVNHLDPLAGIHRLFLMKPGRGVSDPTLVLGGILCHWPDNNLVTEERTLEQSPVVPALVTFAERIWRGAENDCEDLYARMAEPGTNAHREFAAFERDLIAHRDRLAQEGWPFPYVKQTDIPWRLIGPFDHQGDFARAFGPEKEIVESYVVGEETHAWNKHLALGGTIHLNHFFGWEGVIPSTKRGTVYAFTRIHTEEARTVGFWIQFGTPSTSARRSGGNPPLGKWSPFDARIWVNGEAIAPPRWNNPGPLGPRPVEKEVPFTNEGYHYRNPTPVRLRAGWNRVLLRVPFGKAEGYRAGKWMFTCVPISWDGRQVREADGIRFAIEGD